jgi:hypothetical protein
MGYFRLTVGGRAARFAGCFFGPPWIARLARSSFDGSPAQRGLPSSVNVLQNFSRIVLTVYISIAYT